MGLRQGTKFLEHRFSACSRTERQEGGELISFNTDFWVVRDKKTDTKIGHKWLHLKKGTEKHKIIKRSQQGVI